MTAASGMLSMPLTAQAARKGASSTTVSLVVLYILGSICSSVFIVICNKEVFENGFPFPLTMSFVAYCFTWLYYKLLEKSGAWRRRGQLPRLEKLKVAASSICSISFMNLCLLTNTVAIYQICKFAVIPCTLLIQAGCFKVYTSWKVLLSLGMVLAGVGYASDVGFDAGTLSSKGIVYATVAVLSTSMYRIWQETKQAEFKLGPIDFQASMSGWQAALGLVAALCTEAFPVEKDFTLVDYFQQASSAGFSTRVQVPMLWLIGVCTMALTVNFTSFGLIGKTGPVTYAVVGHAKTILTILMGLWLFPREETSATVRADIIGVFVAIFGVVAYGHFEYCRKCDVPDVVDKLCNRAKLQSRS